MCKTHYKVQDTPLQQIYDLFSLLEPIGDVEADKAAINEGMKILESVTLEDIGLSEEYVNDLREPECMSIAETDKFEIAAFLLPKGYVLPLHDHPHMVVCSKMLAGSVNLKCFSPQPSP